MGGCAAVNCSNHSRNKVRLFKFPVDAERRRKWAINCRRDAWVPGPSAELCFVHFEESQFEQNRADGWKKLKPNAIPTLFDVPNPPAVFANKRIKGKGLPKSPSVDCVPELHVTEITVPNPPAVFTNEYFKGKGFPKSPSVDFVPENHVIEASDSNAALLQRIAELEAENSKVKMEVEKKNMQLVCKDSEIKNLKLELESKDRSLSFLSEEEIRFAGRDQRTINQWSNAGIIKGLKLRFALGKFGYTFLRTTGYPAPSYSTLNRRLQNIPMSFGVLHSLLEMLEVKVKLMDRLDKFCCISEFEINISLLLLPSPYEHGALIDFEFLCPCHFSFPNYSYSRNYGFNTYTVNFFSFYIFEPS